jgi:molybdate transport system regulatory protein
MSYRRAWLLLEELNASFREPVTRSSVGGAGGGGVEVTDFGHELVAAYRSLEGAIDGLAPRHVRGIASRAVPAPAGAAANSRRPLNRR